MKKSLLAVLLVGMAITVCSCGGNSETAEGSDDVSSEVSNCSKKIMLYKTATIYYRYRHCNN